MRLNSNITIEKVPFIKVLSDAMPVLDILAVTK